MAILASTTLVSSAHAEICEDLFKLPPSPLLARNQYQYTSAGNGFDGDFDFARLEKIVNDSRSVEEVLVQLPASLRRDFTLVLDSKSSQQGDQKNPRVIVSNADSTFLMSFNGQPDSRGGRTLEVITFDRTTDEFIPYEIEFLKDGTQRTSKNPERCAGCHGLKFRPIWDSYPFWPRLLGGIEKPLHPSTGTKTEKSIVQKETKLYQKFLTDSGRKGRYGTLIKPEDTRVFGYLNTAITNNLVFLKARQIGKKLAEVRNENPEIGKWIEKVLKNLASNGAAPLSLAQELPVREQALYQEAFAQLRYETREQLKRQRARKINQHLETLGMPAVDEETALNANRIGITDFDTHMSPYDDEDVNRKAFEADAEKYAQLRFLVETVLGWNLTDWGMSLHRSELPMLSAGNNSGWNLILSQIPRRIPK